MSFKKIFLSITLLSCAIIIAQQQPKSIIETLKEKEEMIDTEASRFMLYSILFRNNDFTIWYMANTETQILQQLRQCMENNNTDNIEGLLECYNCHMVNITTALDKKIKKNAEKIKVMPAPKTWQEWIDTNKLINKYENKEDGIKDGIEHVKQIVINILSDHTN